MGESPLRPPSPKSTCLMEGNEASSPEATSAEQCDAGLWGAVVTAMSLACLVAYLIYMAGFLLALRYG